jgi:uncharacterized protein YqjF (DUF2071 family)
VGAGTNAFALIETPARQAATLRETRHRPWPLPDGPWRTGQTRHDVLFAHWPVDARALEPYVPAGLELDSRDGAAWVGITPFRLSGLRLRGTVPVPGVSSFLELDLRTYVTAGGRPGILLLSLDASSRLAVEAARRAYGVPSFHAAVRATERAGRIEYRCARRGAARPHVLECAYAPVGAARPARPGSLEAFLVERYCLYSADGRGRLHRAELHHPPWPLRRAEAELDLNTMPPDGIRLAGEPAQLHFCERQDILVWPLRELAGGRA